MSEQLQQLIDERDALFRQNVTQVFDTLDTMMITQYGPNHNEDRQARQNEYGEQDLVELSGCTGTLMLVQEDYFVIGNVGDSPIFIFREEPIKGSRNGKKMEAEQVTIDHKPDMPEESKRIISTGGLLD